MKALIPTVALALCLLGAGGVAAGKPKLSEVAEKAKSPPPAEPSDTSSSHDLSQEKTKEPVVSLPPPVSPPSPPPTLDCCPDAVWGPLPYLVPVAVMPPLAIDQMASGFYRLPGEREAAPLRPPIRGRLGLIGGGGGTGTDAMDGFGGGGVLLGLEREGWSVDLRGWRSAASFGRELTAAFRDLHAWSGDLVIAAPLLVDEMEPSVRLLAGARVGRLDWSFRNPVTLDEAGGTRSISRDTLGFAALFAGLELELFREAEWSLAASFALGRQQFAADTGEGFENDLFEDGRLAEGTLQVVFYPSTERRPAAPASTTRRRTF